MKKSISLFLVLSICLGLFNFTVFSQNENDKEGFSLVPVRQSTTGINVNTDFVFSTPTEYTAEQISAMLSMDEKIDLSITQNSPMEFIAAPKSTLLGNTVYILRLSRPDKADITWAFQTQKVFEITSSLPRDCATDVPANSGIEITFSEENYKNFESNFEISPKVSGRFEYHGKTAVFVPNGLDFETVYTVTIKQGVIAGESENSLNSDYTFSFETKPEKEVKKPEFSLYFSSNYSQFTTTNTPIIRISSSLYTDTKIDLNYTIYKFQNQESAVDAIKLKGNCPSWSIYYNEKTKVDTSALNQVSNYHKELTHRDLSNYDLEIDDHFSEGFYLLEAASGDALPAQYIFQITNIGVNVLSTTNGALVWVCDMVSGQPLANAVLIDSETGATYAANNDGVAQIDKINTSTCLNIKTTDDKQSVWLYHFSYNYFYSYGGTAGGSYYPYYRNAYTNRDTYWSSLQLDRTLFQKNDTVSFWGFAKERDNSQSLDNLTIQIDNYYSSADSILLKQSISTSEGFFDGQLVLPDLDVGNYYITIKNGNDTVASTGFSVQTYTKPDYKMTAEKDKKAIFLDESVNFKINTAFFEGTPVADLDVAYSLSGYGLTSQSATEKTDKDGNLVIHAVPKIQGSPQGFTSYYLNAEADLPEAGRIDTTDSVKVAINDVNVQLNAKRDGQTSNIKAQVNKITLDKLNNPNTTGYYDYIGEPVANKSLNVQVYRSWWEKVDTGSTYYDYIDKTVQKIYRYQNHEEVIKTFSITSDSKGMASYDFTVPDVDGESYFAKVTCVDGANRPMKFSTYIGKDYSNYYHNYYPNNTKNRYVLETEKTEYFTGEQVSVAVKNEAKTVANEKTLFVVMQRGILDYTLSTNGEYSFSFDEKYIPNCYVYAVHFNKSGFRMLNPINLAINKEEKTINIDLKTDKETYQPGEICTLTINTSDKNNAPKSANVNLSIVDEALFALRDYSPDTLRSLYAYVSSGYLFDSYTHYYLNREDESMSGGGGGSSGISPTPTPGESLNDQASIRENFKDTANFIALNTDSNGTAVYTFKLPDNITSWRITASAITSDLLAGNTVKNITATLPMFIHYTLSKTFLTGDMPYIGVNVYGTSLHNNDKVTFKISDNEGNSTTASGNAYERINIPLWRFDTAGDFGLVIKASVDGQSDAVKHKYSVVESYREIETAQYFDVTDQTVFSANGSGIASVTFTDKDRGGLLADLISTSYSSYGDRIEKVVARKVVDDLIRSYFPDTNPPYTDDLDLAQYQQQDGGLAMFSYAESDLEISVKLLPFIKDNIDTAALKKYLTTIYNGENSQDKIMALYGLAQLSEPVLSDLNKYAQLSDLSPIQLAYMGLAYCEFGEMDKAGTLFHKINMTEQTPYVYVEYGETKDDSVLATSAALMLATKLQKPQAEALYQYCVANHTHDILKNIEKLIYISEKLSNITSTPGEITYSIYGDTYTKKVANYGATVRLPVKKLNELKINSVTGNVGAVMLCKTALENKLESDPQITVKRRYYLGDTNQSGYTFKQGDIIRVQIWIDYAQKALDGSYMVYEYLPSGLEYVPHSAKIDADYPYYGNRYACAQQDGKKISFYDYNNHFNTGRLYYYYARVISPGEFKAEGTSVQNLDAKGSIAFGNDDVITIIE